MRLLRYIGMMILLVCFLKPTLAESVAYTQLEKDYPLLMQQVGHVLQGQRANYIFAIDVSGTMNQYEHIVVPAMSQFVASLSEGDNISFIRFGTKAKVSLGGLSEIDQTALNDLQNYVQRLYERDPELFANTDLYALLTQISQEMRFQKNNLTFVFVLTDFVNDPAPGHPTLTKEICFQLRQQLEARAVDHHIYMYALQLPVGKSNQLSLFRQAIPSSFHFETFSIATQTALKSWFDRKKSEILLDKFKAIIGSQLQAIEVSSAVTVDIDGHLQLDASWYANSLLKDVQIDSLFLQDEEDSFDLSLDVPLPCIVDSVWNKPVGQIKHHSWGFHPLNGKLGMCYSFPTQFDDELKKLEIQKPTYRSEATIERTLFTAWLPLWLFLSISGCILLYLLMVLGAFVRNRRSMYKINGAVLVNYLSKQMAKKMVCDKQSFSVGCQGADFLITSNGCNWKITFFQQTVSSWKPWKKPIIRIRLDMGKLMRTTSGRYRCGDQTRVERGEGILIDDFLIKWM